MKTYTIIGGVNGTGKSSLTGVLKAQTNDLGHIVDVDKITAENGGSAILGGKIALQRIRECLDKGLSFTQETTLSGRKTEITAQEARERGYSVRLYYVGLDSAEECLQRIENRVAHGGHNIREEDVLRRFAGRWEALAKVLPYCDEAHFFDNYNGTSATAGSSAFFDSSSDVDTVAWTASSIETISTASFTSYVAMTVPFPSTSFTCVTFFW